MSEHPARLLGLIGGMSWQSSADYYRRLNQSAEGRYGHHHNPPVMMSSLSFAPLVDAAQNGQWDIVEDYIVTEGIRLQAAGCSAVALTAVTAHRCHHQLSNALRIPVPHIFDAAASALGASGIQRVGILATKYSFEGDVLQRLCGDRQMIAPSKDQQCEIDKIISQRLTAGVVTGQDRTFIERVVAEMQSAGAEAVVLACTELPLLLPMSAPGGCILIDSVALHVEALCDLTHAVSA